MIWEYSTLRSCVNLSCEPYHQTVFPYLLSEVFFVSKNLTFHPGHVENVVRATVMMMTIPLFTTSVLIIPITLQASSTTSRRPSDYDLLTLDQVSGMTDYLLLKLFAECESNEMWKRFTYTCGMLPAACSKFFQSFGSEHKARSGMKTHLQAHLKSLLEVHKSKFNNISLIGISWAYIDGQKVE